MLDPTPNRDELLLRPIVSSAAAKGSVLVLGRSDWMVAELLAKSEVTEVIYAPGGGCNTLQRTRKLRVIEDIPAHLVQRRTIGRDGVDFLFLDLGGKAWDRKRASKAKEMVHEFRPRATAYRYVQLDIVAEWAGAGFDPHKIDKGALDLFAKATGIWVEPRTAEFAQECLQAALTFKGRSN